VLRGGFMFRYEYPQFEKKHLLRVEMIEQLRDFPLRYLHLSFGEYCDGIVSGCRIAWDNGRLTVFPGILYRSGNLYFMDKPYIMECLAENRVRYLKIQFLTEAVEKEWRIGSTRIVLEDKKPDLACEMELCRFRLQKGARLRDTYENFEDCSTEYDVINQIHAPFAAKEYSTLHPSILKQYARETLRNQVSDPYDVSFAINIMSNGGMISAECIWEYLDVRLDGSLESKENQDMYQGLLRVLKEQEPRVRRRGGNDSGIEGVWLM